MCNCKADQFVNKEHKIQWCSNCLETRPYRRRWTYLSYVMGVILFFCLLFRFHTAGVNKPVEKHYYVSDNDLILTDSAITAELVLNECVLPNIAIAQSRIPRLVFGAWDEKAGAVGSQWDLLRDPRQLHKPEVIAGVMADECAALLAEFFQERR